MSLPIKSDALEVVSGGAANPRVISGTADPTAGLASAEGSIYLRYVVGVGQAFVKSGPGNNDWDVLAVGGGGIGGSLDDAYDFGGAGLGRTVIADAGALQLDAFTANTQAALTINRQPSGSAAAVGIDLVLSGNLNATGVGIQIADAGAGISLKVTKSNAGSVYFADLTNAGAKALEVVVTAAPTSVSPVSIVANTTGTTVALLSVSKIPAGSTAGDAIYVSMGANTTGAGVSSTTAGSGPAIAGINSSSSAGAMSIRNTNVAGPVDFYAVDSGGTARMSWGYGNASYSDAARAGRAYVWRNTGVDFVLARTGVVDAILKSTGEFGIGADLTVPRGTLHVQSTAAPVSLTERMTSNTNIIVGALGIQQTTTGDMAAGFGVVTAFRIRDSAGVDNTIGDIGAVRGAIDTTGDLVFRPYTAGAPVGGAASERMRLSSTGVLSITQSLADPADGTGIITLKNTLSTSLAQIVWQDNTGVFQAALGSSNPSVQGQIYLYCDSPTSAGLLLSGPGGTNMNLFAGVANGAGFQLHSGSAVVVSDASTGRMRYLTAGQKFQFSLNGGAYVDVPVLAAALTTSSVLFANSSGQIAQDNATFRWVDATNNLQVGASAVTNNFTSFPLTVSVSSTDIVSYMWNTNTAGYSALGFLDSALTFKMNLGYGNSTTPSPFTSIAFIQTNGCDLAVIASGSATPTKFFFGMSDNSTVMQMQNGTSAAVSAASTGRIRYNSTTQTFQVSLNGAAYTDLTTAAPFTLDIGDAIGSSTIGSVLFVGAGNVLQQDNANFFWDDTNNRLGIGTATPSIALDLATGTAEAGIQFRIGTTLPVSAASTGRIRYNATLQKLQASENAGAYRNILSSVERLSADGAADPTITTTFVSGTGTDLTLADGSEDGFIKNFVVTGGSGTVTPANLADGNVLTWTATPANMSFIWDVSGATWHVYGNPYNMVTT